MEKNGWLSGLMGKLRGGTDAPSMDGPPAAARSNRPGLSRVAASAVATEPAATPMQPKRPVRTQMSAFLRQRIRDRFLGSRFPGVAHSVDDLAQTDQVIKTARLFFEDGDVDRACEWLAFASDANPDERLWLAQMEILFLKRQAVAFTTLAAEFKRRFPDTTKWDDLVVLGARLAPEDPLFAGARKGDGDAHYGPWPQIQNWIEAPFDLTGDVLAAEFHAAMRGGSPAAKAAKDA